MEDVPFLLFLFDHRWKSWLSGLHFTTWRRYKRASKLSQTGITISKLHKARHRCGQISGWHRFSSLPAAEHNPRHYKSRGTVWGSGTIFSLLCPVRRVYFMWSLCQMNYFKTSSCFLCYNFQFQSCWKDMSILPAPENCHCPRSSHYFPSLFSLSFCSACSALPGWNAVVWASVNCGLSTVAASGSKPQSLQGLAAAGCRCAKWIIAL